LGDVLVHPLGKMPSSPGGLVEDWARDGKQMGRDEKVCTTDPDAPMPTTGRNQQPEPSCEQHASLCDQAGVIVDMKATTRELDESGALVPVIARVEAVTGIVTVDSRMATADQARPRLPRRASHTTFARRATSAKAYPPQTRSIAASSAALMPGSSAECPASGTIVSRARSQTETSSTALSGGQIMS